MIRIGWIPLRGFIVLLIALVVTTSSVALAQNDSKPDRHDRSECLSLLPTDPRASELSLTCRNNGQPSEEQLLLIWGKPFGPAMNVVQLFSSAGARVSPSDVTPQENLPAKDCKGVEAFLGLPSKVNEEAINKCFPGLRKDPKKKDPKNSFLHTIFAPEDAEVWVIGSTGPVTIHQHKSVRVAEVLSKGESIVMVRPKVRGVHGRAILAQSVEPGRVTNALQDFEVIDVVVTGGQSTTRIITVNSFFVATIESGTSKKNVSILKIAVPPDKPSEITVVEGGSMGPSAVASKLVTAAKLGGVYRTVTFDLSTSKVALLQARLTGCDGSGLDQSSVVGRVKTFFDARASFLGGKELDDSLRDYSELRRSGEELRSTLGKGTAAADTGTLLSPVGTFDDVIPKLLGMGFGFALQIELRCTKRKGSSQYALVARLFNATETEQKRLKGEAPPAPLVTHEIVASEADLGHLVDATLSRIFAVSRVRVLQSPALNFYDDPQIEVEVERPGVPVAIDSGGAAVGEEELIEDECADEGDHLQFWWRPINGESTCSAVDSSSRLQSTPQQYPPPTRIRCRGLSAKAGAVRTKLEVDWNAPGRYLVAARLMREGKPGSLWAYRCFNLEEVPWQLRFTAAAAGEVACEPCAVGYTLGASVLKRYPYAVQFVPIGWLGFSGAAFERSQTDFGANGGMLYWSAYAVEFGAGAHLEIIPARFDAEPGEFSSRFGVFVDILGMAYMEFIDLRKLPPGINGVGSSAEYNAFRVNSTELAVDVDGALVVQGGVRARMIGRDIELAFRIEDRGFDDPIQGDVDTVRHNQRWMFGGTFTVSQDIEW